MSHSRDKEKLFAFYKIATIWSLVYFLFGTFISFMELLWGNHILNFTLCMQRARVGDRSSNAKLQEELCSL